MATPTAARPGSAATPTAAESAPDTALVYSLVRFDDGGAHQVVEVLVAFESVPAAERFAVDGRFGDYAVAPLVFTGLRPTDALR